LALGVIGATDHLDAIALLHNDATEVTVYDFDTGSLQRTTVGQMARRASELLDASRAR
jgi:hypothetical protein